MTDVLFRFCSSDEGCPIIKTRFTKAFQPTKGLQSASNPPRKYRPSPRSPRTHAPTERSRTNNRTAKVRDLRKAERRPAFLPASRQAIPPGRGLAGIAGSSLDSNPNSRGRKMNKFLKLILDLVTLSLAAAGLGSQFVAPYGVLVALAFCGFVYLARLALGGAEK